MKKILQMMEKNATYPVGRVNGAVGPVYRDDDFDSSESEAEYEDEPYEQEFVEREMRRYAQPSQEPKGFADDVSSYAGFSELDSIAGTHMTHPMNIYKNYNFRLNTDIKKELPIDSYKDQILTRIDQNQVLVIEGPTGCGKTTQVPQIIMDSYREKNLYCNIVVTQPRKIATINVAKRVCEERGWTLGTVCGYQVGLERKVSNDAIITYVTIGVLLQKLIRAKCLRQYTHIIIDEVHERNHELDFLLLLVRKFLYTNSPDAKVILMSATIRADEFAYYFRKLGAGQTLTAPIITIKKESQFHKTVFYLDTLMRQISQNAVMKFDIVRPEISDGVWRAFLFLISIFTRLETTDAKLPKNGSVLVFLPGINEIEEAHSRLVKEDPDRTKYDIVPLHSSLPNEEQARIFKPPKAGARKIILSTNIAESSVTVPDSSFVIDFCQTKVMTVDPVTKYMNLRLEWASHVNCDQRAGRVGRTCDGRVYRLVAQKFYMDEMSKQSEPEILRAPLDQIVLQAKMLGLNETPAQILALAMKPPNLKNIEATIWKLKEIGALLRTCRGVQSHADGDITFLGEVMSSLPLAVNLSKLIILGQLFSCLEETIIIAAGCSIQNIFSIPFQKRLDAYKKVLLWSDGSCSDLIALLNLYTVWHNLKRENVFHSHKDELEWSRKHLVSLRGLREWEILVTEIKERLGRLQIRETYGAGKVILNDTEKPTVLKVIIAGAFYPNFFIKSPHSSLMSEREAVKAVGGRDPFSTIFFTGMDPGQPGQVYVRPIKRMIRENGEREMDVHIGFDGSSKVYVEFKNCIQSDPVSVNIDGFQRLTRIPGRIPRQVYEMIRKRQLRYNFQLTLLPTNEAWEFAEKHGIKRQMPLDEIPQHQSRYCFSTVDYSPLPSIDTEFVQIHISSHIDAGHFWAQNANEEIDNYLQQMEEALNGQPLAPVNEPLKIGKIYAARYFADGHFYRCKVTVLGGTINQIIFIDYGNVQEVRTGDLFYVPQRPQCLMAPLAFECVLHGVKPAYRHNPLGMWDERVNEDFKRLTDGILLYGEVYSVVNDVVELIVYRNRTRDSNASLNQYLLTRQFADPCNPSFLSKQNHELRLAVQSSGVTEEIDKLSFDRVVSYNDFYAPNVDHATRRCSFVQFKGPFSPLEMKLHCCTNAGCTKTVDVEGTSVNAVLLDSEPESTYSRLLVALYVGQSVETGRLTLRQTTLMPSVPGFPMLLAAIFCPTMEPKINSDKTLVATVLCGLGYNEATGKPYYPAHDMVLHLDTDLREEELEGINRLRYLMNNGVKLMRGIEQNLATQNELLHTQIKIKQHLFDLINMERLPIGRRNVAPQNLTWGHQGGLRLFKPSVNNDEDDIWQLLWFVKLAGGSEQQREVSKNLEDMEDMTYKIIPFEPITCRLCKCEVLTLNELRRHIISQQHKDELEQFQDSLEVSDDEDDDDDE